MYAGTQMQPLIFNIGPRHVNNVKYYEFIVPCVCVCMCSLWFYVAGRMTIYPMLNFFSKWFSCARLCKSELTLSTRWQNAHKHTLHLIIKSNKSGTSLTKRWLQLMAKIKSICIFWAMYFVFILIHFMLSNK